MCGIGSGPRPLSYDLVRWNVETFTVTLNVTESLAEARWGGCSRKGILPGVIPGEGDGLWYAGDVVCWQQHDSMDNFYDRTQGCTRRSPARVATACSYHSLHEVALCHNSCDGGWRK
jgi:hypothetical protein